VLDEECPRSDDKNNEVHISDNDITGGNIPLQCWSAVSEVHSLDQAALTSETSILIANNELWAHFNRKSKVWAFFISCSEPSHISESGLIYCILCYPGGSNEVEHQYGQRKMKYMPSQGITSMKKHYKEIHLKQLIALQECLPGIEIKKRNGPATSQITFFFACSKKCKRNNPAQKRFVGDLVLYIVKAFRPIPTTENIWFRRLILRLAPCVTIPFRVKWLKLWSQIWLQYGTAICASSSLRLYFRDYHIRLAGAKKHNICICNVLALFG